MSDRICSVDGCERTARVRGWCNAHYHRWIRDKDVKPGKPLRGPLPPACLIDGCGLRPIGHGWCSKHYTRWRTHGDPQDNGGWGDGHLRKDGYHTTRIRGRYVKTHRLVMEQILGRPLLPTENVHHINGVRHDNRPENLELWTKVQPCGQRVADQVAWAQQILALYGPMFAQSLPDI